MANKGHEGHSKGQKAKSWKVDNFFMFLGPFGVNLLLFLVFPSFKAVKAKKVARVAKITIFWVARQMIQNRSPNIHEQLLYYRKGELERQECKQVFWRPKGQPYAKKLKNWKNFLE